ncbi:MAG: CPBP family intramembrane metalloprotease [Lachnospiraceae bacterium]|nr:CPBP family intramembrane metalloprotease [Lachnospiraceae bacterium]
MEKKFRQVIRGFFPTVAMVLIQTILGFVVMVGIATDYMLKHNITSTNQLTDEVYQSLIDRMYSTDANVILSVLYGVVCCVIFTLWYRQIRKGMWHESLSGYGKGMFPGLLLLAVALQFLTGYITEVCAIAFPSWAAEYEVLLEEMGISDASVSIGMIIYTVVLAPIAEELCFRGVTYTYLRRGVSMWSAIIIQAILFAGFHGNFFQASYTLVFGLFVGYIYAKSENILLTIGLHMGYNFIAMFGAQYIYLGNHAISFFCILLTTMVACYIGVRLVAESIPHLVENRKDSKDR